MSKIFHFLVGQCYSVWIAHSDPYINGEYGLTGFGCNYKNIWIQLYPDYGYPQMYIYFSSETGINETNFQGWAVGNDDSNNLINFNNNIYY